VCQLVSYYLYVMPPSIKAKSTGNVSFTRYHKDSSKAVLGALTPIFIKNFIC